MTTDRNSSSDNSDIIFTNPVLTDFKQSIIDKFRITVNGQEYNYYEYLQIPMNSDLRRGDEANAVDQQFTRYMLEWLGFGAVNWDYNVPQGGTGKKLNRPDYLVKGSIGTAFIVEDKNSTIDFDEKEHLEQMRRYCTGTAGYAIWCNMRRLLAIRFLPTNALKHEILVDISIENLYGGQQQLPFLMQLQASNLALFQLLFGKDRFTKFTLLAKNIAVDEKTFEEKASPLDTSQSVNNFIDGSKQVLNHLKLAAQSQIQEAKARRDSMIEQEKILRQEWKEAIIDFSNRINYVLMSDPIVEAIAQLTSRLGDLKPSEIRNIGNVVKEICLKTQGAARYATILPLYEIWQERALRINNVLISRRFEANELVRTAEAFSVWSERQLDERDVEAGIFAEQVAYVFFVRLLLIRILEDKRILRPRLASDGGFADWSKYVSNHFKELDGISILNETFCTVLSRKASSYYLHFFQQAIFDWFNPDDFLLVETLEFLSRYNFQRINSDIIGFTYEAYIERNARDRKGHFLTRQDLVEYMLDLLGYTGVQIIGRKFFDPACGSGSFLVHAARRYRQALITSFCISKRIPVSEENLKLDPELRKEFASRYLEDLTTYFFGMELNPFACYLAEMNLLIQALDELFILQQAGVNHPIEKFQIYNTDSLGLPREVLDKVNLTGEATRISIPDRLSERLSDEAYPIKASLGSYAEGFFYIISNPPYVSSKQELLDTQRFKNTGFYGSVLSGDTNLYLLFLRLGLHYLANWGQMIYIVPLTILGDRSASAARKLLSTYPFKPTLVARFYRGDILFPGVDQAVCIVKINHSPSEDSIMVSGGNTIAEVSTSPFRTSLTSVIEAVPQNQLWQGNWLIAQNQESIEIWQHVKIVSANLTRYLGTLIDDKFERKQGDINATSLNPLRLGANKGSFSQGDIAIYKGEDIKLYSPLSGNPSDWARPLSMNNDKKLSGQTLRVSQSLEQLKQITGTQKGILLREVARLNTRERLIVTWFERNKETPIAFTHEIWRMILKENTEEKAGKALLAIISSKVIAYLINLFSTNNHVTKDDLGRIPIPNPGDMKLDQLADLVDNILQERSKLENDFVSKYNTKLPEFDDGTVYIPPSVALKLTNNIPKLRLEDLIGRGEVRNNGSENGKVKALRLRNLIICNVEPSNLNSIATSKIVDLFLNEPKREDETWSQAKNWLFPDPIASKSWLSKYNAICEQAQMSWNRFVLLQQQIDNIVANWYGFSESQRKAINEGLPWAKRRRGSNAQELLEKPSLFNTKLDQTFLKSEQATLGFTKRTTVKSSQIYAIGYDYNTQVLEIEFVSGEIWQYQPVPLKVYEQLETASSKGKFFINEIKGRYHGNRI